MGACNMGGAGPPSRYSNQSEPGVLWASRYKLLKRTRF